jgi:hypothetical protein
MTHAWIPKNPDHESVVRQSFERQRMMATLCAALVHLAPGEVIATMLSTVIVRPARDAGSQVER